MSLRIRAHRDIICAAENGPEEGDAYIDDLAHRRLAELGVLVTNDGGDTWIAATDEEVPVLRDRVNRLINENASLRVHVVRADRLADAAQRFCHGLLGVPSAEVEDLVRRLGDTPLADLHAALRAYRGTP